MPHTGVCFFWAIGYGIYGLLIYLLKADEFSDL